VGPLTDAHMKVVRYLREQQAKGAALTIRSMGKSGVVTTKELYDLFPGGPLKKSSKIAGIPKARRLHLMNLEPETLNPKLLCPTTNNLSRKYPSS
jgi:hypothetical protein